MAIGGILLTCLSSWNVREELQSSHRKEFQWAASDRVESVRAVVDQGLDALLEIRGLLYAAQEIDESELSVFADAILQRRPYIDSLLWAPQLSAARQDLSPAVAASPPPTAAAAAGMAVVTGSEQGLRIPVVLAASRTLSQLAKGIDLNTSSELAALFARARESGKIAVSGRMTLVLEEGSGERLVEMTAGQTFVVPKGVWHTGKVPEPSTLIGITAGKGTEHRPA